MSVFWSREARQVLIDTSAYYAALNRRADHHARVLKIFAELGSRRLILYTTNLIVAEAHALVLKRLGRAVATDFLQQIYAGETAIVRVRSADERRAREIITIHDDKDYTLTDATSFAVMERLGISTAFTFDRHFAQYGFTVLGPDDP
jgi:predicted nucleic acid-binding protein